MALGTSADTTIKAWNRLWMKRVLCSSDGNHFWSVVLIILLTLGFGSTIGVVPAVIDNLDCMTVTMKRNLTLIYCLE